MGISFTVIIHQIREYEKGKVGKRHKKSQNQITAKTGRRNGYGPEGFFSKKEPELVAVLPCPTQKQNTPERRESVLGFVLFSELTHAAYGSIQIFQD
ncbi:MAG: hypothetical protein IJR22_08015 [Acidaminococcaceae bacterium]|nr:hypothetical protein [Acidaminococcaceae bacterium]